MSDTLSREEWVAQVGRSFSRSMPDMYPEGFAYWSAEDLASKGAYDRYAAGEFPGDKLWVPDGN